MRARLMAYTRGLPDSARLREGITRVGSLAELEQVVSYSSDYWRLNQRNQPVFEGLGDLRVVVLMHRAGQITLSECGKRMLLVLVTRRLSAIDWDRWKTDHTRLATLVNQL